MIHSYTSPDGSEQTISYIADDHGYRVIGGTSFGKGGNAFRPSPPKAVTPPPAPVKAVPPPTVQPTKVNVPAQPVDAGHHILVPVPLAVVAQFVRAETVQSPAVKLAQLPYPQSYSLGLPFFPGGHVAPLPPSFIVRLVKAVQKK